MRILSRIMSKFSCAICDFCSFICSMENWNDDEEVCTDREKEPAQQEEYKTINKVRKPIWGPKI